MAQQMEMVDVTDEVTRPRSRQEREADKADKDKDDDMQLGEPERPLSSEALELSTKPVIVLRDMVSRGDRELAKAEQMVSDALATFNRKTARSAYGTPEMAAASIGEHRPALLKVAEEATALATAVYQQSRLLQDATAADRQHKLSDSDLARANKAKIAHPPKMYN